MKLLAVLDTETTGKDPEKDAVVEVAIALWSLPHRCTVRMWSILLQSDHNEAQHVNGIPVELLRSDTPGVVPPSTAWANVRSMFERVDAIVAYNAEFDRQFIPASIRDLRPWICAMNDIEWPRASGRKLVDVALAHGIGVASAHRAADDVALVTRLLDRVAEMGNDIEAMLARATRPKVLLQALVEYDDRQVAKDYFFRWEEPPNAPKKRWVKWLPLEDASKLPFPTVQVHP